MNPSVERRRAPLAVLLSGLLFALPFAATATAQTAEATFRVGTWNLEFLGAAGNFRNDLPPRTDQDLAALGKKIRQLGVAVLAVQEVNDEATLRKVAAGAGPSWAVVLGTSGGWDDGKTAQRLGFVYDGAAVELLFAEELQQLPRQFEGAPIFHRVPLTAAFRHKASRCDFRLVTVHLKAGQKPADEHKRRGEARALAAWLEELHAAPDEDRDVLLLGDFNSSYGAEPEQVLEQSGAFRFLDQQQASPTIMHFADPIDHVVAAVACTEVRRDSLAVDADFDGMDRNAWRRTYSDHFPVSAALVARGDDDPQAIFRRVAEVAPAAAARPRAAGGAAGKAAAGWPPATGAVVLVTTTSKQQVEGRLLHPLPDGPGGWVVLETDRGVVALAYGQVESVRLR